MSLDLCERIRRLVRRNPEYGRILQEAIRIEEEPPDDFTRDYGWEWHQVRAHPAQLTKLVSEGILTVRYKSRRYTHYKLIDRERDH